MRGKGRIGERVREGYGEIGGRQEEDTEERKGWKGRGDERGRGRVGKEWGDDAC